MDDGSEFVSALYDALELDPSNVFLLERIIEAWNAVGDESMAREYATTLLQIDTTNTIAYDCLLIAQNLSKKGALLTVTDVSRDFPDEWASADKTVEQGYSSLLREARLLEEEYSIARPSGKAEAKEHEEAVSNLSAMSEGRVSTAVSSSQTLSVKEVARQVAKFPSRSQELLHEDFESVAQWATAQEPPLNKDQIRQRLFRRKDLLEAALPDSMKSSIESAMMLAERHSLAKKYVNNSTMLGEAVEDIPRGNFFVSEDNFAWDMEELAQALKVNDGVMRNPYSRNMFSESDIRKIMRHPLAQVLRPLQIAQNELKKGIRPATIDWVAKVGRIMLADQSPDAGQSRKAMDEFLAYSVTLPDSEQTTLNSLKIPARDSHTGQAFDYTIGTSVGDAKANVTLYFDMMQWRSDTYSHMRNVFHLGIEGSSRLVASRQMLGQERSMIACRSRSCNEALVVHSPRAPAILCAGAAVSDHVLELHAFHVGRNECYHTLDLSVLVVGVPKVVYNLPSYCT